MPLKGANSEDELEKLVSYTGCVPFFLFHFLTVTKKQTTEYDASVSAGTNSSPPDFDSCWEEFVQFPPLQQIGEHLRKSLSSLLDIKESKPATFHSVRSFLISCIADGAVGDLSQTDYDCRYFWRERGVGHCLNGFVRDTMGMLLHEMRQYAEWMMPQYVFSAIAGSRNPSVRGFLVEQACIHAMLNSSAEYVKGLHFRPSALRFFDQGNESSAFVQDAFCMLYVPRPFNYKAVDAIIRILPAYAQAADFDGGASTDQLAALQQYAAIIVPVQITLRNIEKHQSSVASFFSTRSIWLAGILRSDGQQCSDQETAWIFHWIVPQKEADKVNPREDIKAEERSTRRGAKALVPIHSTFVLSIETITGKPDLLRTPPASPSK